MVYASCHPTKPHVSKGMCGACYQREKRKSQAVQGQRRVYNRKYYLEHAQEIKSKVQAWKEANRAYADFMKEARRLNTAYSLTAEQYLAMLERQKSLCKICGQARSERLCVDHDHTTGKVRGLLCQQCNSLLGMAHDNPEILQQAIEYLKCSQLS